MKIYLAGPLFSAAERAFNARLRDLLVAANHQVWLPQEREPRRKGARYIFKADIQGIDWAEIVIANMDGADPDSGTCWECGYAYEKKDILIFRTDFRNSDDPKIGPYNLMLTQSATWRIELPFSSVEQIADRIVALLSRKAYKQRPRRRRQ